MLAFPVLGLYTRFDASALLDHEARRAMLDRLRAYPGLTVGELAHGLGVDYKTAQHHARMLAKAGQLVVVRDGRLCQCYLPGGPRERPPAPRVVAALVAMRSGALTPSGLARALGLPRGTAGGLLEALVRRGLARRDGEGYRLSASAEGVVADQPFSSGPGIGPSWSNSRSAR